MDLRLSKFQHWSSWHESGAGLGRNPHFDPAVSRSFLSRDRYHTSERVFANNSISGLKVLPANTTRWNSHFYSISRALELRDRIQTYCFINSDDLEQDTLSKEEWAHLQEIHDSLLVFAETTKYLESNAEEGRNGSVWEWLPTIELLMNEMIKYIENHKKIKPPPPLLIAHQNAFEKLKKYYEESDKAHTIYAAATILCPETRYAYFVKSWNTATTKKHLKPMLKAIQEYYNKNYSGQVEVEERPAKKPSLMDIHLGRVESTSYTSPFDIYVYGAQTRLIAPLELNLLSWWTTTGPPQLRQMALDLLSIPATSCAVERVFSSAGHLLSDTRTNRMSYTTIEARECLRNWRMTGLIEQ